MAFIAVRDADAPELTNTLLSILPQVVAFKMSFVFGEYEGQKIGLTFDKINEKVANYTFSFGLLALVFDLVFFSMLGLYLEKVLPKEFGERQPLWFLCKSNYWSCCRAKKPKNNQITNEEEDEKFETKYLAKKFYEPNLEEVA